MKLEEGRPFIVKQLPSMLGNIGYYCSSRKSDNGESVHEMIVTTMEMERISVLFKEEDIYRECCLEDLLYYTKRLWKHFVTCQ